MPLYEYRCESCGRRFEILQRMGEGPAGLACPHCGSEKVAKQFSTFASAGAKGADSPGRAPACGPGFT
ncbi:MAG: FmdB family zinc ribbon protein [Acidobacteriota bacterium]